MAVTSGQVALNANNAVEVVEAANENVVGSAAGGLPRRSVTLFNPSGQVTIYVGGDASVTSGTGFEMLTGGAALTLLLAPDEELWAIAASATPVLHFIASGS